MRIAQLLIGSAWSQLLLVWGLALVFTDRPGAAQLLAGLGLFAGGLFLAMWLVIDKLVPRAGRVVVITLQAAAVLTFCVCGGWAAYSVFYGQPPPLMLPL